MIKKSNKILKCAHCETEVNSKSLYEEDSGNYYCCEGCQAVYHIIHSEGYSSFYNRRVDWKSGAVENIKVSSEYFEPYVIKNKDGYNELSIIISGIRCAACVWLIENSLRKDNKIHSIRVNYANHKAKIIYDPNKISLSNLLEKFTRLGYCPLPNIKNNRKNDLERKDYFYRFGVSAFFTMQLMLYSIALYAGYFQGIDESLKLLFQLISWGLSTPVIFYSAEPFYRNAYIGLKNNHFSMDTLVALGTGSAYLYSIAAIFLKYETYFDTVAMITTLILLGRFIELGAKQQSGDAVDKLLSLTPKMVKKIINFNNTLIDYEYVTIPVNEMKVGDYFEVEPGKVVASDGRVVKGSSHIDESMLTGEPAYITKEIGSDIYAGTNNIDGILIVKALTISSETFISKIAKSVEEAQNSKAPIQDIADKFISKFVPFVLLISIVTFIVTYFIINMPLSDSLMRAVSILVIACPCAMGLATPLAIICSTAKLTNTGIIFKGGDAIENFAHVNDFYFDKTGTITKGCMSIKEYLIEDNIDLSMITTIASYSKHPASKTISLLSNNDKIADNIKEVPGKGVIGIIGKDKILIGSNKFLIEEGVIFTYKLDSLAQQWTSNGYTVVYTAINGYLTGVFSVVDIIRDEVTNIINLLQKDGNNLSVLTGDNIFSARNILNSYNINIYADLTPFDKANIIKSSKDPLKTVMIGDGINDAIALAAAQVGVSMRNGTDISMESSSAVLLRNDLNIIIEAFHISKRTLRIIKENLFWAFFYNIVAIPLAITGLIHPIASAIFMSLSSLLVIGNSLRIKN